MDIGDEWCLPPMDKVAIRGWQALLAVKSSDEMYRRVLWKFLPPMEISPSIDRKYHWEMLQFPPATVPSSTDYQLHWCQNSTLHTTSILCGTIITKYLLQAPLFESYERQLLPLGT